MPKINVLPEFDLKPDRECIFSLWDQAVRKTPNAVAYLDSAEEGEENIPKILATDKIDRPFVAYDTPEEVRDNVAQGLITAAVPANFFTQAYLAVYIAAEALLNDKPMPHGWVKVPHVTVDKTKIVAYQKAWDKPETGFAPRRPKSPARTSATSTLPRGFSSPSGSVGQPSPRS